MGSATEFRALCEFLSEKKVSLEGLVDTVFRGLESADEAFEKMKSGSQFGNTLSTKILTSRKTGDLGCA
jgi:threonine dehydrogenase-like Zn-dependent dehydrogenase